MIDIEEGHLFPSFALARSLTVAGHNVLYISIADNEDFIRSAGFSFYPLFKDRYPKGFRTSYKQSKKEKGLYQPVNVVDHLEDFTGAAFNDLLKEMKADIIVMSCFLNIVALILYYQSKIKPVMLRPFLREPDATITSDCIKDLMNLPPSTALKLFDLTADLGYSFTSFSELVKPLESFYELVICSKELKMEGAAKDDQSYYIGSGIDPSRYSGDAACLQDITARVIYASLGSQAIAYRDLFDSFFRKLTAIMARPAMKDIHLVITVGAENQIEKYTTALKNVTVVKWISQMDILKIASLAVVHGGLGTIKECIYHEVPMIIMPVTHDQPSNGKRVEHHKLGLTLQIADVSEEELENKVLEALDNPIIKNCLGVMKNKFVKIDNENMGLAIIEKLLPKKGVTV